MYIGPWQEYKLAKIIANLPEGVKEAVIHQRSQSDRRDIPVSLPEIEIPRSSQGNSRSSLRRPTGTTSRSLGGLHNWENNEAFGFVPTDTKRTKKPPKYLPPTQKRISGVMIISNMYLTYLSVFRKKILSKTFTNIALPK
jgi:hypothetical protein